jgi:glycogen synthase
MKRAMARNFSWDASAQSYEVLYKELIGAADKTAVQLAAPASRTI